MTLLEYISSNTLPCLSWLDFTTSGGYSISGSTFTALNKVAPGTNNFAQSDLAKHPNIAVTGGLNFTANKNLVLSNNTLLQALATNQSYTVIAASDSITADNNNLLTLTKADTALPYILNINYDLSTIETSYSRAKVYSELSTANTLKDYQVYASSFNILSGLHTSSTALINPVTTVVSGDKGYAPTFSTSTLILGNSFDLANSFKGNLYHFLIFSPSLSIEDTREVVRLLTNINLPQRLPLKHSSFFNTSLVTDISENLITDLLYKDYTARNSFVTNLDVFMSLTFISNYVWVQLSNTEWYNMDLEYWTGVS